MPMHRELEHVLKSGASILEVIKTFIKHHSGPMEGRINKLFAAKGRKIHEYNLFGFGWLPLFRYLPWWTFVAHMPDFAVGELFFSIHAGLTKEILWLCDSKRESNVYLVAEPQTPILYADRNSRARLFSAILAGAQRLGLSHETRFEQSYHDVYSLCIELALLYLPFRRILTRILVDNPDIHRLPIRTRFRKFIHEPWITLGESHPQYITTPPVIVLHWDPRYVDEELLRSVCEFGSSPHSSSLLWILSIDIDFKLPMQDLLHLSPPFQYFRLPVPYHEGPADAATVLNHDFSVIRHHHKEMFDIDDVWPSEAQMSELVRIVSGVFETVDVIIQFVNWMDSGGPKPHLETFLACMVDSPSPSNERPYCALDHFYTRALSDIPRDLLLAVKKAFSVIYWGPLKGITSLFELACLLSLEDYTLFPYLYRLGVFRTDGRHEGRSHFRGFLEDPQRSGRFYISESECHRHAFNAYSHILSHSSNLTAVLKPVGRWIKVGPKAYRDKIERLREIAGHYLCDVLLNPAHVNSLHCFDFRCLAHAYRSIPGRSFFKLVKSLHAVSVMPERMIHD